MLLSHTFSSSLTRECGVIIPRKSEICDLAMSYGVSRVLEGARRDPARREFFCLKNLQIIIAKLEQISSASAITISEELMDYWKQVGKLQASGCIFGPLNTPSIINFPLLTLFRHNLQREQSDESPQDPAYCVSSYSPLACVISSKNVFRWQPFSISMFFNGRERKRI